ncbi:MAG TPA: hypothetical protein VGG14_08325 [Candidatus Sulfotelmatobacter sp.]|jgi:hypothetical protein
MALQHVPRCQHVKVNGVQCGSPALRRKAHCYFHTRAEYERNLAIESKDGKRTFGFPLLEDANSIQVALMKVIQMLGEGALQEKKAGVMIYALQTASNNLRHLKLEPEKLTDVVIDEDTVDLTQISGPQWASRDFPDASPADVQSDMEELVEEDSMQDELEDAQASEHGFRDEDLAQNANPQIPPVTASARTVPSRAALANARRVMRASKPPAPIVDPEVLEGARRREQKRKLTRDLEGDDSLAATLLRRMGLPVELDEDHTESELRRT